jgi:hypothetical protein
MNLPLRLVIASEIDDYCPTPSGIGQIKIRCFIRIIRTTAHSLKYDLIRINLFV